MWYATMMDHIRALLDGSVLVIPIGVMWKVPVWQMIAVILIYVALQANKMYLKIFADSILGDTLGKLGKDIMRMVIQGSTLGIGVLLAVLYSCKLGISNHSFLLHNHYRTYCDDSVC